MKLELDRDTGMVYRMEDLQMRLGRSLVRYDGKPFYIMDAEGNTLSGYFTGGGGEHLKISLPDKRLDISPVSLGYVNTANRAFYTTRVPHRRYKQGLCPDSLRIMGNVDARDLLKSVYMHDTITGNYPSYLKALSFLSGKKPDTSRAFSRRFCITKDGPGSYRLLYRAQSVGTISKKEIILGDSHVYLAEELASVMRTSV